jgi:hypothetical protein
VTAPARALRAEMEARLEEAEQARHAAWLDEDAKMEVLQGREAELRVYIDQILGQVTAKAEAMGANETAAAAAACVDAALLRVALQEAAAAAAAIHAEMGLQIETAEAAGDVVVGRVVKLDSVGRMGGGERDSAVRDIATPWPDDARVDLSMGREGGRTVGARGDAASRRESRREAEQVRAAAEALAATVVQKEACRRGVAALREELLQLAAEAEAEAEAEVAQRDAASQGPDELRELAAAMDASHALVAARLRSAGEARRASVARGEERRSELEAREAQLKHDADAITSQAVAEAVAEAEAEAEAGPGKVRPAKPTAAAAAMADERRRREHDLGAEIDEHAAQVGAEAEAMEARAAGLRESLAEVRADVEAVRLEMSRRLQRALQARQMVTHLGAERREQLGVRVEGLKAQLDVERLTWRGSSAPTSRRGEDQDVDENDDGTDAFRDKIF